MTDSEHCFDVWAIRKLSNTNFGQEYWDKNDTVNYQNILTYNNSYDDNDNSLEIQVVNEDDNNAVTNASSKKLFFFRVYRFFIDSFFAGNSYAMNTNNPYDNYQQQYPGGG